VAIRELTQRFVSRPWAATFLLIVSPLVTWLWLGAIIAALGGLIALWPLPPPRRRRAPAPSLDSGPATATPPVRAGELV
jgi:cytochrome c-type biogenesis protein CcmF